MEFIKEIHEARMTRGDNNLRLLTYNDCKERAYLSILCLEVLRRFPKYAPRAVAYAQKTKDRNYEYFRVHATDLYNFVYFLLGDSEALSKLKDPGAAMQMRKTTTFPQMAFNRYISKLASASAPDSNDQQTLVSIENALKITNSDYKSIRRAVFSFDRLPKFDQKKLVTRLLYAVRAKLRSSDIISDLEQLAADKNLEVPTLQDPEPTISSPDIGALTGRDLALYRMLVGSGQLGLFKKFMDQARNGQAIPAAAVQAYMPIIKLVDNLVKAGPGYITLLRTLEKRAKRDLK
jgi:hypothetical protein